MSIDTGVTCKTDFVVINGDGRSLLCRETAVKLGLLRLGPSHAVNAVNTEADIKEKYKELFNGVGLLRNYELKLNIDESVKPVAQPVHRIPFGVRDNVERKLDELMESGIIEEVPEGPTGWVSPLVVIPKADGDIRICVDMRCANQAIVRERQPIPTIVEVLQDLNGSTVFSRVDLKWRFQQIPLADESRHVTTFVTHRGLYRYTRLMFGVTSAPEKYQQIIQGVLRGCEGVANVADDLIIHGRGEEQHDKRLLAVLDLLTETEPIQRLTHKNAEFKWGKEQQLALEKLKELITHADVLAYFNVNSRTRIVADASPVGLGAVLTQLHGSEWRVIGCASRRLSDVERRYSQTEKEALALVWACERFNRYVFGREFELETDHKPLEYMYSQKSKPSARVERWVLRLQAYHFKVVYRPGKTNIADALSRLNCGFQRNDGEYYDFVHAVVENSVPCALTPAEIEKASAEDMELNLIKECVQTGYWSQCNVPAYLHVKNELCSYGGLLLRGSRLVIPRELRPRVLELAHEGHQGESLPVVVYYFSRYFEVVILRSTSNTRITEVLKPLFYRFGVPHTLKTDNGPQLVSEEFEAFLAENGIEHRTTTPLWPQANGEVERQNRTLMKSVQIAHIEGKDWCQELQTSLTAYRSTPQMTTGATPFYLMFGREMRSKLPDPRREAPITNEEVRDRDWSRKLS
ncbi:Uncharacterized protein K02A2.6 [Stylophora pistillata]|uniref:Uncharacterized protein K02A2.6 n=1 Tax=Stylophora pistillata TaxID=50429 RepID=A0A2B4SQ16_STYPI|nr:Uncharacterized protein K02A2.6 [Stylophora pistillata]